MPMQLDISVEEPWPEAAGWDALAERVAAAVARTAPELARPRLAVSLLFSRDEEIRALNRQWRGKDRPTNVLSFPMLERAELVSLAGSEVPVLLGDIAIAFETCAAEAAEKGVSIEDHAAHLIAHGLLHLAGYDHETSSNDAETMELLEIKALAILGIADPYVGED